MSEFEIAKWAASIAISLGAILVSVNVKWSTQWWPYVGFLLGHVIWSVAAWRIDEMALFWLNFFFIPLDSWAIYIRINKQTGEENGKSTATQTENR